MFRIYAKMHSIKGKVSANRLGGPFYRVINAGVLRVGHCWLETVCNVEVIL